MRISQRPFRDAVVIEIADEFTFSTRKQFSDTLADVKRAGCRHLIVNLEQVTFMDSAALGLLALTTHQFKLDNRRLSLVSPQGTVKQILELANFHKLIPMFSSEDAAAVGKAA